MDAYLPLMQHDDAVLRSRHEALYQKNEGKDGISLGQKTQPESSTRMRGCDVKRNEEVNTRAQEGVIKQVRQGMRGGVSDE